MEEQDLVCTRQGGTPDCVPSDVSYPLRGVVLCCTSIPPEKRTVLASQAEQMGASHKYDLTSDITHLIVGEYDTPKYRYVARERPDVKILTPNWIEAVRQLWIEAQPIDVCAMEREHTLPTFASLRICLTGFEDPQRKRLIEQVIDNGGEYHGDLTKSVTHLVANKPEGQKYKHAKIWGLQVVSVEWLQDSLERGMILDEKLFNPEWPAEERGKDAWNRGKPSLLGKRSRSDTMAILDEGKRKLRRTASTKLSSQNEKIWGDIFKDGSTAQAANGEEWETATETLPQQQPTITAADAKLSPESGSLPRRTVCSLLGGIFSGCHFYIHGFDARKTQLLEEHLLSHQAEIVSTLNNSIGKQFQKVYMVVPHSMSASELPEVPQCAGHIQAVTEWWVERCIGTKSLVDPVDYILGRPFPKFPLEQFAELTVCSTGFEGLQLLHVVKAVGIMGAKYVEMFSKNVSVLICNSTRNIRREKLLLAHEWNLPTVSLDWLLASIQKGERQPFSPYIQRIKKTKLDTTDMSSAEEEVANKKQDDVRTIKTKGLQPSLKGNTRPATSSKLDPTAFQDDIPVKIETEELALPTTSPPVVQPLNEISPNSLRKPESPPQKTTQAEATVSPVAMPQHAISTAMISLLAKSKCLASQTQNHEEQAEAQEGARKRRAPSRILGRAASNVSAASAPISRASSVDSTGSAGQAVVWPSNKSGSGDQRGSSSLRANLPQDAALMTLTTDLEGTIAHKEDTEPPLTQMQYEDPESNEYQAMILARIKGEKLVRKEKEKVATIASLDMMQAPRVRKGRALRERQSGGGLR